ncbi:NAD-dependent epimerase/dehydratase family protein [Scytonema sp. UIC 10036]|uniref:NAD-dependent epimerase/dehydratase family protein n=1 Tax=Scytonema sp. UIC 10036 TaxID=2304196 RepID=UPI0012DA511D|nr:NAD-dependent epimerase/dehydratase family protein [Scytonema sp. UIC 10036]MUG96001.1 NAD-dependent epimerase/dehydratase family protein [Scytonema sp. UIC 10036]
MNLNNKTLFITGIGNFIALRAAQVAIANGMKVRGLEASPLKAQKAQELGVSVFIGSTNDEEVLEKACEGADIVFHTASMNEAGGCIDAFRTVNVDGTVKTATVAKKVGAKTFVHLSSVLVYGFRFPDNVTEEGSLCGENNPFCQTKIESEQEILKFNNPRDFGVILIRAGDIYGPGADVWILRPLKMMQKKKFVLINGGRGICNHVFVDNLIDGVFLAIEKETYGEAFNITDGCKTTWKEYYTQLAKISDCPPPMFSVPAVLAKARLRQQGKNADVLPETIDFITRTHSYSIEKARCVLGYEPRINLSEGMAQVREWLIKNNLLTIV